MTPQDAVQKLITAGWSELRIAREVGTSQPTIHRIKHGQQRRGASFDTCTALIQLAEALLMPAANDPEGPSADAAEEG